LSGFENDARFNPDPLPGHADQGTATVAWVDGCVGLQEALERPRPATRKAITSFRADDSMRYGVIERKWTADGKDPVSDLYCIRVPYFCDRQIAPGVNLDDRKICFLIATDDFGLVLGLVLKANRDLCGLIDDVMIRRTVTGLGHNETSGQAARLLIAGRKVRTVEEIEEIERLELTRILWIAVAVASGPSRILGSGFGTHIPTRWGQVRRDLRKRI